MPFRVSTAISALVVVAVVALGAYWYLSPFVAIHVMLREARAHDADAFNEHVDYVQLRESVKGQLSGVLSERLGGGNNPVADDLGRAGAALASLLGSTVVDPLVDTVVRPESVMRAMQEARIQAMQPHAGDAASGAGSPGPKVHWSYEREGVNRIVAYGSREGEDASRRLGLVFDRSGFATWKLTGVRLPSGR